MKNPRAETLRAARRGVAVVLMDWAVLWLGLNRWAARMIGAAYPWFVATNPAARSQAACARAPRRGMRDALRDRTRPASWEQA
jgi:hypothetical protein